MKESLIGPRFGGDEVEDEYLQEKLPSLIDRIVQSGKSEVSVFSFTNCVHTYVQC